MNKRFSTILFVFFLSILYCSKLYGLTIMTQVMVQTPDWEYTSTETNPDSISISIRDMVHSFESGMLETLFDQGLICFNNPPIFQEAPMSLQEHSTTVMTARSGGASLVLLFSTGYSVQSGDQNRATRALSGELTLLDQHGRVLGNLKTPPITSGSAFSLGKQLANNIISIALE